MIPHPSKISENHVAHRYIADRLRAQILRGEMVAGTKLPSTGELSQLWNTSNFTVHTALKNLVKEGLLERRHGRGTFVCERSDRLVRVGIYQGDPDIWTRDEMGFYRQIHCLLEAKLKAQGAAVRIFFDRRNADEQATVLPELATAVANKEIQGLIVPLVSGQNLPAILALALPMSFITGAVGVRNKVVSMDSKELFRGYLTRLLRKQCRTVGLISSIHLELDSPVKSKHPDFEKNFRLELESHGMETCDEWIISPDSKLDNPMNFGYRQFLQMWETGDRPDALIAYPDVVVPGIITAALQLGLYNSNAIQFCFHRNKKFQSICPFPVIWSVTDEDLIADKLIEIVKLQFAGESLSPVYIPFTFVEQDGAEHAGDSL
jgi:DNA-binding LacI/PurR family transcriptional regulator